MESQNFAFLKEINSELYQSILVMEENARIKPVYAAQECRRLLNTFISIVQKKHGIKPGDNEHENLLSITKSIHTGLDRVPQVQYKVIDMNGVVSTASSNCLFYLKEVGNSGAHKGKPNKPGVKYVLLGSAAIIKALRAYYDLFTLYYRSRINNARTQFLDANVPLGKYSIKTHYVPTDADRSKCIMEYTAQKDLGTYSKKQATAIIREYDPRYVDDLFLNRNIDAYSEALEYTYSNGVKVGHLNNPDEEFANFYIVYEFVDEVVPLDKFLKKNKLQIKDRVQICKKLAEALSKFHNAEFPIYHRMLNYTCIVISDFSNSDGGYVPYITKFDFAKITSIKAGTVFNNLSEAEAQESKKFSRYKVDIINPDTDWAKVDIYSLGVLFVDIMLNNVSTRPITDKTFEDLIDAGISDEMIDIIDEMLCEKADERPSIDTVLEAINKECNNVD